jgi:magnesium transporter
MPELRWKYGYPFALGLMTLVAGAQLWFFRRRGWIGKGKQRGQSPDEG